MAGPGPGDPVSTETSGDLRRPRYSARTVVRRCGSCIVVSCWSARGVSYVHRFDRRPGVRIGGAIARLVAARTADGSQQHGRIERVEAAYREWARHRADVDTFRRLHDVISKCLDRAAEPAVVVVTGSSYPSLGSAVTRAAWLPAVSTDITRWLGRHRGTGVLSVSPAGATSPMVSRAWTARSVHGGPAVPHR